MARVYLVHLAIIANVLTETRDAICACRRFLADEQQKLMTRLETRSLPGANMATQTEMHAGTQTTSSCLRLGGGGDSHRSRSYGERDCSKSADCPRRSYSVPRRRQFNSPIIEETGSGSGTSLRSADAHSGSTAVAVGAGTAQRRQQFATATVAVSSSSSSGALATTDTVRKSRSYSCLRELDLDRQLQYMTPSLRSRALARRRLSTSLPPHGRCHGVQRAMQMLEKKSVFTIAYGDAATQKINCSADSSSNNWD